MTLFQSLYRPFPILLGLLLALGAAVALRAQIEPGNRGVPPIDSSSSYEVSGVTVDVRGKDSEMARAAGWREAQRKGWKMLWGRVNGQPASVAPALPDSTLDSIVAGIVIEKEEVGPSRYIARLGVLFDRARTGQYLGVHGQITRSPPMLLIPVLYSGSTPTTFEQRNAWQEAWAHFRTGGSPIDYVRVSGTGADPLLLNPAQAGRPGRGWWRMLLDQYGAADILVAEVTLHRRWPGGPAVAEFVARHGPDDRVVARFSLRAPNSEALPRLMEEGVRRIDAAYTLALRSGQLVPDSSLVIEDTGDSDALAQMVADSLAQDTALAGEASYAVQVDTPDAASLTMAEAALRGVPGVQSIATTSLALGGVSVIRVTFLGTRDALRAVLSARGWRVEPVGESLRLTRAAPALTAPPAAPAAPVAR